MSSALFGPDGTQLPDPPPVLPDPLIGPAGTGLGGTEPSLPPTGPHAGSFAGAPAEDAGTASWSPPPAPWSADAERLRRAIAQALGEPAEPSTPPTGIPVQPAPPLPPPLTAPVPPPPTAPLPPVTPLPGPARPRPPAQSRPPVYQPFGRRGRRAGNPLVQERISRPGSAWMGCLVALIFLVAVSFNAVQSLIHAIIELFR